MMVGLCGCLLLVCVHSVWHSRQPIVAVFTGDVKLPCWFGSGGPSGLAAGCGQVHMQKLACGASASHLCLTTVPHAYSPCHPHTQVPVLTERQQLMAASAQLQAATQRLGPFACGVQQVQLADAMHANLVKEAAAMRTLTMVGVCLHACVLACCLLHLACCLHG